MAFTKGMTARTHTQDGAPKVGDSIGRYRIVGALGDGNLGRLYFAQQHGLSDIPAFVALRCVHPDLARTPYFETLFSEAAAVAPRFEHPNVVAVHELTKADGVHVIATEYLPGESLASILERASEKGLAMPLEIAASLVKQAANAVQYLHDRLAAASLPIGLGQAQIHASSSFVTYHGLFKLLGLGFQPIRASHEPASGEHPVGSWKREGAYVAPEESQGVIDPRTDVFCLGSLLWTCLTGRMPEPQSSARGVPASQVRAVLPSRLRADVPEALEAIVMKALAPSPADRFQSPSTLADALERYFACCESRPTPQKIRRWLVQCFDIERASLQLQLARGRDVETALRLLDAAKDPDGATSTRSRKSLRPRELWAPLSLGARAPNDVLPASAAAPSSASLEPAPVSMVLTRTLPSSEPSAALGGPPERSSSAPPPRASRAGLVAGVIGACALVAVGAGVVLSSSVERAPFADAQRDAPAPAASDGRLEVKSTPEGAAVFVDGEPTGLSTPAVLKGLPRDRAVRIRVEKTGFASEERQIVIAPGSPNTLPFELVASHGLLRLVGVPDGARLYVDDAALPNTEQEPLRLPIGRHRVRVETASALVFAKTVDIVAGEQTLRVDENNEP